MDRAVAEVEGAKRITKAQAFMYRDGLIIALLALIPLRSRTFVALRIGKQLVKDRRSVGTRHFCCGYEDTPGARLCDLEGDMHAHRFGIWNGSDANPRC